jgi:hypothetical protein
MPVAVNNIVALVTNSASYTMPVLSGSNRRVISSIVVYNKNTSAEQKRTLQINSNTSTLIQLVLSGEQTAFIGGDDLKLVQSSTSGQLIFSTTSTDGFNVSINYTDITA